MRWTRNIPPALKTLSDSVGSLRYDSAGWWVVKSYNDSQGNVRVKEELLVSMEGVNPSSGELKRRGPPTKPIGSGIGAGAVGSTFVIG